MVTAHVPSRFLKRELVARKLGANRLPLDIGIPSGRRLVADTLRYPALRAVRAYGCWAGSARMFAVICSMNCLSDVKSRSARLSCWARCGFRH